jgi:flagellar biogenesis protein FliO
MYNGGMFFADAVFIPDDKGDLVALAGKIAETTAPLPPPTDLGMTLVKMLISLMALALLLFASYWFLKRLIQGRLQRGVGRQSIEIVEKRMISPKTMLYLIQVENKKILFAESHLEVKALDTFRVVETPTNLSQ